MLIITRRQFAFVTQGKSFLVIVCNGSRISITHHFRLIYLIKTHVASQQYGYFAAITSLVGALKYKELT